MRNRLGLTLVAGLLLATGAAPGQTATVPQAAPGNLTFDVASVRPSAPLDMAKLAADMQAGRMPNVGIHVNGLRAEYNYLTLKDLITVAYKVKPFQITGPAWLATQRFDVVAKMPEGSTKDDAPKMLQALLAERFKLEVHRDTQEHPVLALVVAKGGAKLKESPAAGAPIDPDAPLKPGEMKMEGPDGQVRMTTNKDGSFTENMGVKGTVSGKMDAATQTMHLNADTLTMDGFADMLTTVLQMGGGGSKQVVDMTQLKGNFQVSLDLSLADIMAMARAQGADIPVGAPGGGAAGSASPAAASDPGGGGSTVYASVEKLGLKLEPRKAPVEQLVVDHAEKTPTEN
jgi:uncharacterized protein (TIGR03435 family)